MVDAVTASGRTRLHLTSWTILKSLDFFFPKCDEKIRRFQVDSKYKLIYDFVKTKICEVWVQSMNGRGPIRLSVISAKKRMSCDIVRLKDSFSFGFIDHKWPPGQNNIC